MSKALVAEVLRLHWIRVGAESPLRCVCGAALHRSDYTTTRRTLLANHLADVLDSEGLLR